MLTHQCAVSDASQGTTLAHYYILSLYVCALMLVLCAAYQEYHTCILSDGSSTSTEEGVKKDRKLTCIVESQLIVIRCQLLQCFLVGLLETYR